MELSVAPLVMDLVQNRKIIVTTVTPLVMHGFLLNVRPPPIPAKLKSSPFDKPHVSTFNDPGASSLQSVWKTWG
jgi:hypothetical protein